MNRKLCAPADRVQSWESINWKKAEDYVKKLQMRIVKAQKNGHCTKVKTLQWLLTHSFYAKALAVKCVTSNKGKNTAGVDHEIWKTQSPGVQTSTAQTGLHSKGKRETTPAEYSNDNRPGHADVVQVCAGTIGGNPGRPQLLRL